MIIDSHVHIVDFSKKDSFVAATQNLLKEMKLAGISHSIIMPDRKKSRQFAIDMETAVDVLQDIKNLHLIGTIDIFQYQENLSYVSEEQILCNLRILSLYPLL